MDNPYDRGGPYGGTALLDGIPDETLYRYRARGAIELSKRSAQNFQRLRRHSSSCGDAPKAAVAPSGDVCRASGKNLVLAEASLRPSGHQAAGNLRKALQMIRVQAIERPLTLKGYINWLDRVSEQGREEAESLLHDHGSDAVQMLTIHRSKGLEFTVVCLANLGGRSRGSTPFMADRSKGRFYLKLGSWSAKVWKRRRNRRGCAWRRNRSVFSM